MLASLALLPFLLSASPPTRAATQARDSVVYKRPEEIRIPIRRAAQPPLLDGKLDDPVWKDAPVLDRFVQYEPVDSVPATQQSVGRVAYDDNFTLHRVSPAGLQFDGVKTEGQQTDDTPDLV